MFSVPPRGTEGGVAVSPVVVLMVMELLTSIELVMEEGLTCSWLRVLTPMAMLSTLTLRTLPVVLRAIPGVSPAFLPGIQVLMEASYIITSPLLSPVRSTSMSSPRERLFPGAMAHCTLPSGPEAVST